MTATAVWGQSNSLLGPLGSRGSHGIGEGRLCCVERADTKHLRRRRRTRRGGEKH